MTYTGQCPACNGTRHTTVKGQSQVYTCNRCGCLHGTCYLGDSYTLVGPTLKDHDGSLETRPFDLTTLGSRGIGRRHGFYDPADRCMTQVG